MDTIKLADRLSDLTGKGTEYLIVDGLIIAKFVDGNLDHGPLTGNMDETV